MRDKVKNVAVRLAAKHGLINLSRKLVCEQAGIPDGSFPHVMGCTFTEFIAELRAEGHTGKHTPVNKLRASPELRKEYILETATRLAARDGYWNLRREDVAEAAGISGALINRYFGTMQAFRREIMRNAISNGVIEIIAQGLASGDKQAAKAPPEIKQKAANQLALV